MTYIPNGTRKRLDWVIRTYDSRPVVALLTTQVVLWGIGMDWAVGVPGYSMRLYRWVIQRGMTHRPLESSDVKQIVDEMIDDTPRKVDAIIPWVAATFARLDKKVDGRAKKYELVEGSESQEAEDADASLSVAVDDVLEAAERLQQYAASIAQWVAAARVNIMGMSLDDVIEEVQEFEVAVRDVPQGQVTYRFPDGWTIQTLGEEQLEVEGELMQHCVGDYCASVASGETWILSLRDPEGMPHVTIEIDEPSGSFVQIMGKQNQRPKPAYAKRVDEWIDATRERWSRDWLQGKMMLGTVDFAGGDFEDIEMIAWPGRYEALNFEGASFRNAKLIHMNFRECNFEGADLTGADVTGSDFEACSFDGATLDGVYGYSYRERLSFRWAGFVKASMRNVHFEQATFERADMREADLFGAYFLDCDMIRVDARDASFEAATIAHGNKWRDALLRGADLTDATLPPEGTREREELDLALLR